MFTIGFVGYSFVELLYRGYTHWTMALTGGTCVLLIHLFNIKYFYKKFLIRCLVGCVIISIIEFFAGCVLNIALRLNIWDYSNCNFNILGQVCLLYSVYWFFLSIPIMLISNFIKYVFYSYFFRFNIHKENNNIIANTNKLTVR